MEVNKLRDGLRSFYDSRSGDGICVYAIIGEKRCLQKLDVDEEAAAALHNIILDSLHTKIFKNDKLQVLNISSADEREDAIYFYDLEIPKDFQMLYETLNRDTQPLIDFNKIALPSIDSLVIEIGDNDRQLVLYKKIYPIEIIGRGKVFFGIAKSRTRLEKVNSDFLRISPRVDMLRIGEDLLILDLSVLERYFGFHEIINREALKGIEAIADRGILQDISPLRKITKEKIQYARKLVRIQQSSPIIELGIPNPQIIQFCKDFPSLHSTEFNETGDKIILNTNASIDRFLKLLMDDYLRSELTKRYYESRNKDDATDNLQP